MSDTPNVDSVDLGVPDPAPSDPAGILVDLTVSRMVHEVVGPIGAINNGLELMQDLGPSAGEDVTDLVANSAKEAGARLQFYRIAYGRAGFAVTNLADLRATAASFFEMAPRHDLAWPLPPILPSISEGMGRISLVLLEIAREALPRGGVVRIAVSDDEIVVTAESSDEERGKPNLSEELVTAMKGQVAAKDLNPRIVHGALVDVYARDAACTIEINQQVDTVTLTASRSA